MFEWSCQRRAGFFVVFFVDFFRKKEYNNIEYVGIVYGREKV